MGEKASQKQAEIDALKLGINLGMTLIDTAEMYGEGGAERVVSEAISDRRQEVYLVSKFYHYNATPTQIALSWLLHQDNVISIPKATNPQHIKQNLAALDIDLTQEDIKEIDRAFKPPSRKMSLAMR